MTNNTLEKIYNIAKDIREQICLEMATDDMMGLCCYASKQLRRILRFEGFRPKLIHGTFNIDNPCLDYIDIEFHNDKRIYFPSHYWLEFDGFIIDVTADQFNIELDNDNMAEIVIGKYEELLRYRR